MSGRSLRDPRTRCQVLGAKGSRFTSGRVRFVSPIKHKTQSCYGMWSNQVKHSLAHISHALKISLHSLH